MYQVLIQQSPELAARQAAADNNFAPYTSKMRQYTPARPAPLAHAPWMDRVIVESIAYQAAIGITPKNETQRRKLQAILDRGTTYESCRFFHPKGA